MPASGWVKLTDEVAERIIQAVAAGNYLEVAAEYAGIHRATLRRWLDRGEDAQERADAGEELDELDVRFQNFADEVTKARARAEVGSVTRLRQLAGDDGTDPRTKAQVEQWFLERSFPTRWGRKERVEVTGNDGGPMVVTLADLVSRVMDDDDGDGE